MPWFPPLALYSPFSFVSVEIPPSTLISTKEILANLLGLQNVFFSQ